VANKQIDEALDRVREYLGPFASIDSLPPQERVQVAMRVGQYGWDRILKDLEYLDANLPASDSRRSALKVQLGIVRKTLGR
jgi:hypothetical protein